MTILSRFAYAVRDATDFPDTVCRLVGQFSATDIAYDPGDLFVRCSPFGHENVYGGGPCARYVEYLSVPRCQRWVLGQQFDVYRVGRVTACQMAVTLLKSYHAYQGTSDDEQPGMFSDGSKIQADLTVMLFVQEHDPKWEDRILRRFRIKKSDEEDLVQFRMLDLTTAISCTHTIHRGIVDGVGRLCHDAEADCLVIKEEA